MVSTCMGLTVDYDEIENLETRAEEGNDIFYALELKC